MNRRFVSLPILCFILLFACASCNRAAETGDANPQAEQLSQAEILARETLDLLVASDFAAVFSRFDDTMKNAVPQAQLEEVWKSTVNHAGSFRAVKDVSLMRAGDVETVVLSCDFQSASVDVQVSFNDAGQIAGLLLRPG